MFACRNCTLRAIRTLSLDAAETSLVRTRLPAIRSAQASTVRYASTDSIPTNNPGEPYYNEAQLRHLRRAGQFEDDDARPGLKKADEERKTRIRGRMKKELVWLQDPVKLAARVDGMLLKQEVEPALELVRMASRDMSCVVSWNHCINWHMANGQPKMATKIFNDMKKRGQSPDGLTYMLLLRGLSRDLASEMMRERMSRANLAVSLYNSMKTPGSKVKPTVLHINAVLRVCTLAGAQDHLWGIVGALPEKGLLSPDHVTYTVILTSIIHSAKEDLKADNLSERQVSLRKVQAVDEGRRVWRGVVHRWRAGQVQIDEELVSTMARILLLSPSVHDWDEVFNLVEQTTDIPRQIEPIGSEDRHIEHLPNQMGQQGLMGEAEDIDQNAQDEEVGATMKVFHPLKKTSAAQADENEEDHRHTFIEPGNKILSVLTEACGLMRLAKVSQAYWNIIVRDYGVQPDLHNLNAQLGNYRSSRASASAMALIQAAAESSTAKPDRRSYYKAMGTCLRNKNNPSSLQHAEEILKIMRVDLADPSEAALTDYLQLGMLTEDSSVILKTLDNMEDFLPSIRARLAYGEEDDKPVRRADTFARTQDTVELLQRWSGALHTLLEGGIRVDKSVERVLKDRRAQITRLANTAQRRMQLQRHDVSRKAPRPFAGAITTES